MRDVVAIVDGIDAHQHVDQRVLADGARFAVLAGEFNALMKTDQMRRRISVHTLSGGLKNRFEIGRHRAFAVGSSNVDHRRQAGFGCAKLAKQALNAPEREIDKLGVQQLHLSEKRVARRPCCRVCHGRSPRSKREEGAR